MAAQVLDGKAMAKRLRGELTAEFAALKEKGHAAHLVSLSIGSDDSSDWYVNNQKKQAEKLGVEYTAERIPADSTFEQAAGKIREICDNAEVTGMILQLPVPKHLDGNELAKVITPEKNVEGVDPDNLGLIVMNQYHNIPCTARAAIELAAESGIEFKGKRAVVLGRSIIVGKPCALLLLDKHCTVTICHSRTENMAAIAAEADILVTAMGAKPGMVTGDFVKPGAVVVDVATIATEDGKYKGDCDFDSVNEKAGWLSPVPGGVGSVTTQILFKNTLETLKRQIG
ncbi:MAG: bifunctional 5,10-methylenetetrahydrofolate dehydrogenase/5,10-methenyltetrahydrofolate cyclohydrolase [Planctomycetes bacterium]|nr:bifunctional 5,10-methylenetetrahydrofolate dehydrogenase/5,10-methenyltetrahydrofolate cyclohydrolase [Planctomycetota bacterium]